MCGARDPSRWRDGEDQIRQGRESVERANERMVKGQDPLRQGQQLIDRGRDPMQAAETRYQRKEQS